MTAQDKKDKIAELLAGLTLDGEGSFIELMQDIGENYGVILNGQLEGQDETNHKREG